MLLAIAAEFLYKAWDMLGLFLPFFILIAIFQLSFTLFTASKLIGSNRSGRVDGSFIKKLIRFNNMVSGSAMTLAITGTVYGLLLALTHLAAGWAENNELAVINTMQGASIALSSTLGGLVIARLWGTDINGGLIDQLCEKFNISLEGNQANDAHSVQQKQNRQLDLLIRLFGHMVTELKSISAKLDTFIENQETFNVNQERVEEQLLRILEHRLVPAPPQSENGSQKIRKKSEAVRYEREPDRAILDDISN